VDSDFRVRDKDGTTLGPLYRKGGQTVSAEHLRYHRTHFGYGA
jgi:hypothetical protein